MQGSERKRTSILMQVAILLAFGTMIVAGFTYISQYMMSESFVRRNLGGSASRTAEEVKLSLEEYPSIRWLMKYWYEHYDSLEIEYDAELKEFSDTEAKSILFSLRHPEIRQKFAEVKDIEALPERDQELYAEIVYSWLTTRLNQIKQAHHMDYLFVVITEEPYNDQFFLFSASKQSAQRGTNYLDVYTLGKQVKVNLSQQEAMRYASQNGKNRSDRLAEAGKFLDYYDFLSDLDEHTVLVGITYNLSDITSQIRVDAGRETALTVLLIISLSLLSLWLINWVVLRPLGKVQHNIRLFKENKDSEIVRKNLAEINSSNEIGLLSEDVAEMTGEIDDYVHRIETITAETERIETELSLASRIQSKTLPSIFPPFPERHEFDIYAVMHPAKEVGGDLYDFFMPDDDHLMLLIADVSGKGVPAALFMMITLALIRSESMNQRGPSTVLRSVNDMICQRNPEEMFVSVWLGVLEISTGKLTAANAGHEFPVIRHPDGKFELMKDKHGFVIGGMEDMTYTEYEIDMEPGSTIFVYTDGLPEATDADLEMFGTDRMLAALNEESGAEPEEIINHMMDAVNAFVKESPQFDDLTMLCLTYNGTGAGAEQPDEKESGEESGKD